MYYVKSKSKKNLFDTYDDIRKFIESYRRVIQPWRAYQDLKSFKM